VGGAKFVGHRRVDLYCQGGFGEDTSLDTIIRAINDCHAVFVAKIGHCPKDTLQAAGIEPVDEFAMEYTEKSAIAWFSRYLEKVRSGEVFHAARGDADIRQGAYIAAEEAHKLDCGDVSPTALVEALVAEETLVSA